MTWKRVRIALLLFVLALVVFFALADRKRRQERTAWDHTVDVAIILVESEPVSAEAISLLRNRVSILEKRLGLEMLKHQRSTLKPFHFTVYGPIQSSAAAPKMLGEGVGDILRYTWDKRKYTNSLDDAANVQTRLHDSRIYVSLRKAKSTSPAWVEGTSDQDGWVGMVSVVLDAAMVDTSLFVITHETLHTLGAKDKYDDTGRTLLPSGLAEPNKVPLYPQNYAEIMARNRPISPTQEVIPTSLDELAIGNETASEIGWRR